MSKQKQEANPPPTMKLAEILSDLVSLRVCDPSAALALVSARPNNAPTAPTPSQNLDEDEKDRKENGEGVDLDPDLKRAKDLVKLHYAVKEGHRKGELEVGLEEARRAVERAVGT